MGVSKRNRMPRDLEQQTPEEKSPPLLPTGKPVLPFDVDKYLPRHQRGRAWFLVGRPKATGYSADAPTMISVPPKRDSVGDRVWKALLIAAMVLLVFGGVRLIVWKVQDPYPGMNQCYQTEWWLHGVRSDVSRVQWALEDAEEEVANAAEAGEANARIWKMFEDMRASLVRDPSPEEVAGLKALWVRFLDLGFEIRDANQKGDSETSKRLQREQDEVLVQRLEEEQRVLHDCRLADARPVSDLAGSGDNHRAMRVAIRHVRSGGGT